MKNYFAATFVFLSALSLVSATASAVELSPEIELTDEMALEEGLTPIELMPLTNMKSMLSGHIQAGNLERAIQTHRLVIAVNKKSRGEGAQTLTMYENGSEIMKIAVSTGKEERVRSTSGRTYVSTTPVGYFRPTKMYKDYLSYTWNAPMPNAVFFIGGIAIHATGEANYKLLGTRASGGCVRTKLEESKLIREKIMETGRGQDFKIVNEAKGRNRVMNNSVQVDSISRETGAILNSKVLGWDTVIVVHE